MSQINTNTIANELGTGGPDFVGMPSVGGDPVVESGSNTDGEWTRWADGTQIVSSVKMLSAAIETPFLGGYRSSAVRTPYPATFLTAPRAQASPYDVATFSVITSSAITSSDAHVAFTAVTIQATADREFTYIATGRWK